jgi:hypothetical protein
LPNAHRIARTDVQFGAMFDIGGRDYLGCHSERSLT